jgi:hypothetical protein
MFSITVDRARRLLEVQLEGLFDLQDVRDLRLAVLAAMSANGFEPRGFLELVDISRCPIQTQAVYAAFDDFGTDPVMFPERLASIVGDSPVRMQARRSVPAYPYALFDNREAALAWLYSAHDAGTSDLGGSAASAA